MRQKASVSLEEMFIHVDGNSVRLGRQLFEQQSFTDSIEYMSTDIPYQIRIMTSCQMKNLYVLNQYVLVRHYLWHKM